MAIGKRLRFEILKRDGFKCRYCGALAVSTLLHVDHVVPRAEGGTDDPTNLLAACADCNLGKSAVPLDESRLSPGPTAEDLHMHTEQIRDYLAASEAREGVLLELEQVFWNRYTDALGVVHDMLVPRLRWLVTNHSLEQLGVAIAATNHYQGKRSAYTQAKYFMGVLRNLREGNRR